MLNDKEKLIKEQRMAEAIDKHYMGLDGKLGIILKYLGHSIMQQGSSDYEVTEWPDVYDFEEIHDLPTEDIDTPTSEIGMMFDGLKYGYHIEIKYLKHGTIPEVITEWQTVYHPAEKVLNLTYKGHLFYIEAENDLVLYHPWKEWEDAVETIYKSAAKIKNNFKKTYMLEAVEEDKMEKLSFLEKLRKKWGI
jgi:hypothetical protein